MTLTTYPPLDDDVLEHSPADAPVALGYTPDDFVDDASWAKPRPAANRRFLWIARAMAVALVGIGTFTLGAKLGKDSTATNTGGATTGRTGIATGLGGTGGGFGAGGGGFGGGPPGAAAGGGTATATGTAAASGATTGAAAAPIGRTGGGTSSATATPSVQGTVTKADATSITVTKADGTSTVITVDNDAEIARRTTAALADVKVGDTVAATGTSDSAGNVAATAVTVGDLEPLATASTTDTTATATTPDPDTSAGLGGLLG